VAIDGGFDGTRIISDPDVFGQFETVKLEVDATKAQLYQDWNHNGETYGRFNEPVPVNGIPKKRVPNSQRYPAVCKIPVGECPYSRECANHATAGDFRTENGMSPLIELRDTELYCESCLQESDGDERFPRPRGHGIDEGFVSGKPA
jgi:hypothetical protein